MIDLMSFNLTGNMAENTLSDNIMNGIPEINELITYAKTSEWNELGIKLGLGTQSLAECNGCVKMYQLWLREKGYGATRRILIKALREIKEARVVDDYVEKCLKKLPMVS